MSHETSASLENDGWRSLAFRRADGTAYLQSRQARDLTPHFPDVAAAVADTLPPETVVDGELIVWHEPSGRTSFPALQKRLTAGRRLPAMIRARLATRRCATTPVKPGRTCSNSTASPVLLGRNWIYDGCRCSAPSGAPACC